MVAGQAFRYRAQLDAGQAVRQGPKLLGLERVGKGGCCLGHLAAEAAEGALSCTGLAPHVRPFCALQADTEAIEGALSN